MPEKKGAEPGCRNSFYKQLISWYLQRAFQIGCKLTVGY